MGADLEISYGDAPRYAAIDARKKEPATLEHLLDDAVSLAINTEELRALVAFLSDILVLIEERIEKLGFVENRDKPVLNIHLDVVHQQVHDSLRNLIANRFPHDSEIRDDESLNELGLHAFLVRELWFSKVETIVRDIEVRLVRTITARSTSRSNYCWV